MEQLKKYWILYAFILFLLGSLSKLYAASYELIHKTIQIVNQGQVATQTYYVPSPAYPVLDILSNILLSLATALVVSQLFIKAIEKSDKQKFENKLLDFQKNTAKDAILSTFEKLIDKDFFEIIKADVLMSKFVRKELRWQYDITHTQGPSPAMTLNRTISYKLHNITLEDAQEKIYLAFFECNHCTTKPISLKYRIDGNKEFNKVSIDGNTDKGTTIAVRDGITIPAGKQAEVVIAVAQTFPRNYIYETHFLNYGAVNLELTVNFPENYEFHLNTTVLASRTEMIVDVATKKAYRISGAIYRGQGIEFLCFPRKAESGTEMAVEAI